MNDGQSSIKEIWESVKYLFSIAFFGFLYGIAFLAFLGMLLQWTLGIDITKSDTLYRLLFLFWGICAIGWYLLNKHKANTKEIQKKY